MSAEMDSPDRNLTITASDIQGSPLFNYLCSLSPIKPMKSVHVAQTFSELTFPPPPAVFVSPQGNAQNKSKFRKRDHSADNGEAVQSDTGHGSLGVDKGKSLILPLYQTKNQPSHDRKLKHGKDSLEEQYVASPCNSPSKLGNKYVEQYLADPVEGELYSVGSSDQHAEPLCLEQAQIPVQADDANESEDPGDCKQNSKNKLIAFSEVSVKGMTNSAMGARKNIEGRIYVNDLDSQKCPVVVSQEAVKIKGNERSGTAVVVLKDKIVETMECTSTGGQLNSHECGSDDQPSELDNATVNFSFFLSESAKKSPFHASEMDNWQSPATSEPSESSIQPSYVAAMTEIINEDAHDSKMDVVSSCLPFSLSEDEKQEVTWGFNGEDRTGGRDEHLVGGFKVCNYSHRVARRRCLDFEVTEAPGKFKNSIKQLGLNSDSSVQEFSFGSETGIASAFLNERIRATSDTVSSGSPQRLDAASQDLARLEQSSHSINLPANSSMLNLTHCSLEKNADCKSGNHPACLTRNSRTSSGSVGMPSGIGLHLNRLAGSMICSQTMREGNMDGSLMGSSKSANLLLGTAPLSSIMEVPSGKDGNCLLAVSSGSSLQVGSTATANFKSGVVVSLVEKTRRDHHEMQTVRLAQVGIAKAATCFHSVTLGIESLEGNLPFGGGNKLNSLGRKRVLLQDFPRQTDLDASEDSSQSPQSPKKKRRKSTTAGDKSGEGCKRCNCKKSKCLKLYCECFAAGVYCVDSCSCHDCFNKPEFEETVLGTRQQIESRNPLAFAPKIIRLVDPAPSGEEYCETPASARHKRGCNCKKSQCQKKYCECYQAGVGCSEGCRCEGCKNIYGMKEGSEESEDKELKPVQTDKETIEDQVDAFDLQDGLLGLRQQNEELSPITPSHFTGQDRSPIKFRSAGRRRLTADVHLPTFSESDTMCPESPSRFQLSKKEHNATAVGSTGMQFSKNGGSPISTPKMSIIGQLSPQWEAQEEICTVTPMPQAPVRPTPASGSILDGTDSSPSLNRQSNVPSSSYNGSIITSSIFIEGSSPVFQQAVSCSPVTTSGSHHFQTPLNSHTTVSPILSSPISEMGRKSDFGEDSSTYCHIIGSTEDDDTPDFLKDPDGACSPLRILKTSSPKHKRVSPPHHHGLRDIGNGGAPSPGVRSGRKFILQAISSFPPCMPSLSPIIGHPNNNANQN
eukprot:c26551_g2_i2 orf=423-3995(-)